jgi:hypothetical protein
LPPALAVFSGDDFSGHDAVFAASNGSLCYQRRKALLQGVSSVAT